MVLDVRDKDAFHKAHVPRSTFIGLDGNFAPWVGTLIVDVRQPILLVCGADKVDEAVIRLSRVGFDNVLGFLEDGVDAWKAAGKDVDHITSVTAEEFAALKREGNVAVVDVRKKGEYASEHIIDAESAPLASLNDHLAEIPKEGPFCLHCQTGYRSLIAGSILKARGFHNGIDVRGGFEAIKETDTPMSDWVCPTTL